MKYDLRNDYLNGESNPFFDSLEKIVDRATKDFVKKNSSLKLYKYYEKHPSWHIETKQTDMIEMIRNIHVYYIGNELSFQGSAHKDAPTGVPNEFLRKSTRKDNRINLASYQQEDGKIDEKIKIEIQNGLESAWQIAHSFTEEDLIDEDKLSRCGLYESFKIQLKDFLVYKIERWFAVK